jgi:hypothetical protein
MSVQIGRTTMSSRRTPRRVVALAALAMGAAQLLVVPAGAAEEPAKLYRVQEGVFDLRGGKSMDLTDRRVLLTLPAIQDSHLMEQGRFWISLNGQRSIVTVGARVDLKRQPQTRKTFDDKDECYLDVIDYVAPKGAPATATFRLSCV